MPFCQKCGSETPANSKYCASCEVELRASMKTVPTLPSSSRPSNSLSDLGSRIAAGIVDYVIIGIITGIIAVILFLPALIMIVSRRAIGGGFGRFGGVFGILVVMCFLWLIYFTYFEGTTGQTIGKKVVRIKVIKEDGSKCDFGSALVRNMLRIIDHLPFLYILGIILIAATDKKQRLGDMLGKTIVVKAEAD